MNDAFAWDIGDLAKFVVLGHLVGDGRSAHPRLGAVWCRTRAAPPQGHGRHISFLEDGDAYGHIVHARAPELHRLMVAGLRAGRSIDTSEYRGMLPEDTAHVLEYLGEPVSERRAYWETALQRTSATEIVFFDPDNGVVAQLPARGRRLYVAYAELEPFLERGQTLILYQHQNRAPGGLNGLADAHSRWFYERLGHRPMVLEWHRRQARLFIVVPAAHHRAVLEERVESLLGSAWGTEPTLARADLRTGSPRPPAPEAV